jgi:hypothetical protein
MSLFCNSRIHVITSYSGHLCVYYASILRCWHLVWILVRTDHLYLGVGCHIWPHKLWPHLLKRYDGTINPVELLQIYTTSILAAGGNEAVMANYFSGKSCAISSRPTLRVLTLCLATRLTSMPCNSARGESLWSFIQRFSQVQNTTPPYLKRLYCRCISTGRER